MAGKLMATQSQYPWTVTVRRNTPAALVRVQGGSFVELQATRGGRGCPPILVARRAGVRKPTAHTRGAGPDAWAELATDADGHEHFPRAGPHEVPKGRRRVRRSEATQMAASAAAGEAGAAASAPAGAAGARRAATSARYGGPRIEQGWRRRDGTDTVGARGAAERRTPHWGQLQRLSTAGRSGGSLGSGVQVGNGGRPKFRCEMTPRPRPGTNPDKVLALHWFCAGTSVVLHRLCTLGAMLPFWWRASPQC